MARYARWLSRLIDSVSRLGLAVSALLVAYMMVTQVAEVILRTIGHPTSWVYDLNLIALLGCVFLGLAGAERGDEHIAVDFLVSKLPRVPQRLLTIFNKLIVVSFLAMVAWFGFLVAKESAAQDRNTGGLFSVPAAIPESLLPIGATLLILQVLMPLFVRDEARGRSDSEATQDDERGTDAGPQL